MKKIAVLSLCLLSSMALANPFLLPHKHHKPRKHPVSSSLSSSGTYTNFSGHWVGRCESEGETMADSMVIEQEDAHAIVLDDTYFVLGGLHSEADTNPGDDQGEHTLVNWDDNKRNLNISGIDYEADYFKDDEGGIAPHTLLAILRTGQMRLEGKTLTVKTSARFYNDGVENTNEMYTIACTYKKK